MAADLDDLSEPEEIMDGDQSMPPSGFEVAPDSSTYNTKTGSS